MIKLGRGSRAREAARRQAAWRQLEAKRGGFQPVINCIDKVAQVDLYCR